MNLAVKLSGANAASVIHVVLGTLASVFETGSHVANIHLTTQIKMLDVSLGRDNWLDTTPRRHSSPP